MRVGVKATRERVRNEKRGRMLEIMVMAEGGWKEW